ncbi:hypothetical protein [Hymenobacter latericus]|uniref:hypothetical protein n=1 Tax=Hymenobacter sp. YIM 151858-1 TaxID=2987688 RepID=UPI002227151A|nr:hypothetical protein [Hymenobacter sp. YIM 151858-1]UYZ59045.1 hypothetical protein OIS50_18545 [Hymenobacter sp. YIM 151858-1]
MSAELDNVSLSGESILLAPGQVYWIIDALYLAEAAEGGVEEHSNEVAMQVRDLFPDCYAPFARITVPAGSEPYKFSLTDVVHGDEKDAAFETEAESYFSTDSAVVVVLAETNVPALIRQRFSYDDLIEPLSDETDQEFGRRYWQQVISDFATHTAGLIFSPGIGSGFDFTGSGMYRVLIHNN